MFHFIFHCSSSNLHLTITEESQTSWTDSQAMSSVPTIAKGLQSSTCINTLFIPLINECSYMREETGEPGEDARVRAWGQRCIPHRRDRCLHFAVPHSHGWYVGMEVPSDIHLAYMLQGSFYLHSVYGTLCLDTWRRDSPVMILHHIITLSLIGFSYALRFHNIGLLVLFLHDTSDFLLEFTKVNVYLRHRGGGSERERWVHARIADLGCAAFGSSWFVCRLYWFPLKVVHTTAVTVLTVIPNMPFYFLFNSLLIILTGMNVYWFSFIVAFVAKVLTGQMKEVDDLREFDVNERVSTGPEGEAATQGERRSRAKRGKGKGEAQENGLQSGGGKKQQ
ncbi:ceramide synthase 1-like isoform X2 [Lampetra planeri]